MASIDEQILRTAKEIMVKFIEVGRVYPTSFHETFRNIYRTIEQTVKVLDQPPKEEKKKK